MLKKIFFLLFLSSLNCFANKPLTCSDISQELSQSIKLMITSICNSKEPYFNKNIRFITNTTNVDTDEWIKKAFFIIIDEKSNIVLSPYNTIFKQIAILPIASTINYRNFIKFSRSQKLPNYSWLQKVNNISSLISSDVESINNMFNNTSSSNFTKDITRLTINNTKSNNSLVAPEIKNFTTGVSTCEHIDPTMSLEGKLIILNMCSSDYFNKNIRFITNTAMLL